jgi:hypothetical protein
MKIRFLKIVLFFPFIIIDGITLPFILLIWLFTNKLIKSRLEDIIDLDK